MSQMMDSKINKHVVSKITARCNDLMLPMQNDKMERRSALEKNNMKRRPDLESIWVDTQKLAENVHDLESIKLQPLASQSVSHSPVDRWTPDHIIIGSWATDQSADEKPAYMEATTRLPSTSCPRTPP